jgi:hypothetical protein
MKQIPRRLSLGKCLLISGLALFGFAAPRIAAQGLGYPPVLTQQTGTHCAFVANRNIPAGAIYQWSHNGTPVSTASALSLQILALSDAGTYTLAVNVDGSPYAAGFATLSVSPTAFSLNPGNLIVVRLGDGVCLIFAKPS